MMETREVPETNETQAQGDPSSQPNLSDQDAQYKKLLEECDKELYPGCKYSNLSFNLYLYHLKCSGGMSNKIFTMLLEYLRDAFTHLTLLPSTTYEAKKLTTDLGLGYEKIHACPNDCILYWGEKADLEECDVCGTPRWQVVNKDKSRQLPKSSILNKKGKPANVLRYFPLIPRLKRIYASKGTVEDMQWHYRVCSKDGKLRHPSDGLAWKSFDNR